MALAMILQYFDLRLVNPSYILRVKETLTQKPDGLEVHATLRDIHASSQIEKSLFGGESSPHRSRELPPLQNCVGATSKPITILYGSNSGTCEGLARSLASRSVAHGFTANVATMDSSISNLPKDQPVVFLTASFEGEPADNASLFLEWISSITDDTMRGLTFAVFGCGHRDWALTYQKIPKIIDKELERLGATRLVCRGESGVSMGTVLDDFDSWTDEKLWPGLDSKATNGDDDFNVLDVKISRSRRIATLKHNVQEAIVEKSAALSGQNVSEKRMGTFRLPSGTTYSAGDYMIILPINSPKTISRVLT